MYNTIDMTGKRYGKLVVLNQEKTEKGFSKWKCICDCGNYKIVRGADLRNGRTASCGCGRHRNRAKDLTNNKYGRLIVLYRAEDKKPGNARWHCKCECGNEVDVDSSSLVSGLTKSCGCYKSDVNRKVHTKHGDRNKRLYRIWTAIKGRCTNPNLGRTSEQYINRGIKMCDEWKNSYDTFKEWALSHGYSDDLSIDRIDVNGNYEPDNCRWADKYTQANNKRNSVYYSYNNETHTLPEWARIKGLAYDVLKSRITRYGWDIETALNTPVKRNKTKREEEVV